MTELAWESERAALITQLEKAQKASEDEESELEEAQKINCGFVVIRIFWFCHPEMTFLFWGG